MRSDYEICDDGSKILFPEMDILELAKLIDEVKDDERLSSEDAKKYYQSLKQHVEN